MKKRVQIDKSRFYVAMAAFALFWGGCTRDIGGEDEPEPGRETDEGKVYMNVGIAMPAGGMTKAGGEGGDGFLVGSDAENAVHDVWIYLVPTAAGYSPLTGNDLTLVRSAADVGIIGAYTDRVGGTSGSALEGPDHRPAVTVSFSTDRVEYGRYYQVLAVVNAGEGLPAFTRLDQLRNYLQEKAWMEGDGTYGPTGRFVMTTHQMWQHDGNPKGSDIRFDAANTKDDPAVATAYVERLAARIDLEVAKGLLPAGDAANGMEVKKPVGPGVDISAGSVASAKDYVRLTGYTVVNRMQAGSYLLKRVTSDVSGEKLGFGDAAAKDLYLGDEVWVDGAPYNYVADPWTESKVSTPETEFPASFASAGNVYGGGSSAPKAVTKTYEELYADPFAVSLNDGLRFDSMEGISTAEGTFTPIRYTQENTASLLQQKNGFTTGLIFRGVYKPGSWSVYAPDRGEIAVEKPDDGDKDFYVVSDSDGSRRCLCKDLKTAGVFAFEAAKDEAGSEGLIRYLFADDPAAEWPDGLQKDGVLDIVGKMGGGRLAEAYRGYLKGRLSGDAGFDDAVTASLKWSAFCEEEKIDGADPAVLAGRYGVAYYKGGTCYYKFWIRHADNREPKGMGVMEFAIVRNNVYQVEVTGVGALGDPLPFTPGKDDPDRPDEEPEKAKVEARIYVKDWVLRRNATIIL